MHKICIVCKKKYKPTGRCQKCCSDKCSSLNTKNYMKAFYKRTYIKRGYKQSGDNNNNWQGGIGTYRKVGNPKNKPGYVVHHKDENRYNNDPSNLQLMTKREHQIEHECWKHLPKGEELASLKRKQAAKAKRNKLGHFIK